MRGTLGAGVVAMQIEQGFLEALCCPVSKSPLRMMTEPELEELNGSIAQGRIRHADGAPVADVLDSGLVAVDGSAVYGIREDVPMLLPTLRIVPSRDVASPFADSSPAARSGTYDDRWEGLSQYWHVFRAPQRPSREDIDTLQRLVAESASFTQSPLPRVLMLGVTPEIATIGWPAGTQLLALDSSPGMIRNVWPAREVPGGVAALADWGAMPVRDAAVDFAVGDGFLTSVPYPDGFRAVVAELRRVLKETGTFVMREFARPEVREPLDTIFRDLREGRVVEPGPFAWRLAMALHGDLEAGCRIGEVCDAWHDNVPEPLELTRSLGWPPDSLSWLESFRGTKDRMWFPTRDEVRTVFSPDFEQVECLVPGYTDGERYPTVVFKPRAR
ncbi:MAG: methyltransferase domain-containing protein [Thermoanaerobaculaceae bacterium]|nr:methyltransferase domain-containing protein [Thermoanaerobaculaceae bacterium]